MTYSIVSGNDDRKFSIEGNQKAVVVLRKPLDFERGDSLFNLTIVAKVREGTLEKYNKHSTGSIIINYFSGSRHPSSIIADIADGESEGH